MRVLAIIPARGGSKGIPGKNIKLLGGKPLIAHAVECAMNAKRVTKIIVSTDNNAIADVVKGYPVQVVERPAILASDTSNVVTAAKHVYEILAEDFDVIVLLQPTAPLRTGADLDKIIEIIEQNPETGGVVSVVPMDDVHPARMYNLENNKMLVPFLDNGETLRRQDLDPVYYRNGCFYAVRVKAFFEEESFMVSSKMAYIMDMEWLVNIDTPRDFKFATILYEDWKNEVVNHGI